MIRHSIESLLPCAASLPTTAGSVVAVILYNRAGWQLPVAVVER
jgi:hypothetical protein